MKTSKISLMGYVSAFVLFVMVVRQYYFLYEDIDKLLMGFAVVVSLIAGFFNYNKGLRRDKQISHIDDVMQEVIR
jgi:hypothetical protein